MGRLALMLGLGLVAINLVLTQQGSGLLSALGLAPQPPSQGGTGGNFTAAAALPPLSPQPVTPPVSSAGGGMSQVQP